MIKKTNDINDLNDIFNTYKNNYNPLINDFTKIYTYVIDKCVVAFLIFTIIYEKCEIVDIFVKNEYRNNKIASKLINEIIKDYDVDNITLEVSEKNYKAIGLYSKLGFKKVAVRKKYYEDCDGLLMMKEVR